VWLRGRGRGKGISRRKEAVKAGRKRILGRGKIGVKKKRREKKSEKENNENTKKKKTHQTY